MSVEFTIQPRHFNQGNLLKNRLRIFEVFLMCLFFCFMTLTSDGGLESVHFGSMIGIGRGRYVPIQGFEEVCPKVIASLLSCGCKKDCSTLLSSCKLFGE